MNALDLASYITRTRAVGKTHAAAKAAQEAGKGALMICTSDHEAKRVKHEYPGEYTAISMKRNGNEILMGRYGNIIVDPDVFAELILGLDRSYYESISQSHDTWTRIAQKKEEKSAS